MCYNEEKSASAAPIFTEKKGRILLPSYKYILLGLVFFALLLLYRWIPSRKVWALFSLTLLFAGAAAFWSFPPPPPPKMTEAERAEIHQQQEIFTAWYDKHKKNISQLDYNWQQYHNILESFKEGAIDIQTAYVRLRALTEDAKRTRDAVEAHIPPLALIGINYDLCAAVRQKTLAYADAQQQAISRTRNAADPAQLLTRDPAEQSRILEDTMIRESPPGLFLADEISTLRDNLTIPPEKDE